MKNGVIHERASPQLFSMGDPDGLVEIQSEFPEVYSVSAGKIVSIISIPEGKKAILVKMDNVEQKDYFYVYSGLEKINFKKGDSVHENDVLGQLKNKEKKYQLRFEFYEGSKKSDSKNRIQCKISRSYQ